jgi:cell division protease FtsH
MSEANAARFDDEVARFVDETHQRVRKILSERRTVLDALAHLLSRQESDRGDEFRITLSSAAPPLAA